MRSMTGFGSACYDGEDVRLQIEIKSVNQRFLDIAFYMPRSLAGFEQRMRRIIKERIARGKVEVHISFTDRREKVRMIRADIGLAKGYSGAIEEIGAALSIPVGIDAKRLADYPDVLKVEESEGDVSILETLLPRTLTRAIDALIMMRETEGAHIAKDFETRLLTLRRYREKLIALAPKIVAHYRARLETTLSDVLTTHDVEIDVTRLVQEVAIYAERVDYAEEVVRLESHFAQFETLMGEKDPVGRKLDFLMQEMNREVNTVGAKANHADAAYLVVDMKAELEKLREQVQNIE